MEFIGNLKIGLYNAWLPITCFLVIMYIFPFLINKAGTKRAINTSWYGKKEKISSVISMLFFYALPVAGILTPLKTGTFFFYVGMIIYAIAFIPYLIANINYVKAPLNEPIVKGVYRISRNPMYFFSGLIMLGICIATACWLMLIILTCYLIATHSITISEEHYCIKTYGEKYKEYMKKTPRYFLFF